MLYFLLYVDSKVRTHKRTTVICGGSIYDKSTIITTGLCCDPIFHVDFDKTRIVAGQIERSHVITGQSKRIKEIILHPDYSMAWNYPFKPAELINNICILKLESDLEFNDNVRNVQLNHETGELVKNTYLNSSVKRQKKYANYILFKVHNYGN